ncbi:branched-chain amino acid ABC transporter permease [Bradyrhizobium jicamae]|uniref:branched-chain amino acid ABC transporter permease n=1 Tax=Bradyrhizobium jicamae TaxID=280332 RepID=UPI001BA8CECF|nr:branched-chain amino acid ABC transporter permease [Bradyrhizobium jicamae]MBR0934124.1 branched-chain amino acid ABC transporter permease [Bradyrhizobium jicamae]
MNQLALVFLNGITLASLYFLVATGFSLTFGLMRTVNLAHGSFYLLGGYVGYTVSEQTGSWVLGALGGGAAAALGSLLLHQLLLARYDGQTLRQALASIAVSTIVADQMLAAWGAETYQIEPPPQLDWTIVLSPIGGYSFLRVSTLLLAVVAAILLWLLLVRTRLGMMIRAGVDDSSIVRALGVPILSVFAFAAALAGAMAGIAGVVCGSVLSLAPGDDTHFLLMSLIVVIIGGVGRLSGAAIGALLVGLLEQFGLAYLPTYSVVLTFALMVAVLAIRPDGIRGSRGVA